MSHSWFESSFSKQNKTSTTVSHSRHHQKSSATAKAINGESVNSNTKSSLKRQLSEDFKYNNTSKFIVPVISSLSDFEPKSSVDLAASRAKVSELKSWFTDLFSNSSSPHGSPFLLLKGPAGSGKTTSLKVLCNEYRVELVEVPAVSKFTDRDTLVDGLGQLSIYRDAKKLPIFEKEQPDNIRPLGSEKQIDRFRRFLHDFNYCRKTVLSANQPSKKLLLFEDIPSVFLTSPELLHQELVALYKKFGSKTMPIVFIISDTVHHPSIELKLLPKSIQAELKFRVISFKPVTKASMSKVLSKSALGAQLSMSDIEHAITAASSDIRNACNYLLFSCASTSKKSRLSSSIVTNKKRKLFAGAKATSAQASMHTGDGILVTSGREEQLTLSHAVAKILYAKRSPITEPSILEFFRQRPHISETMYRNPLNEQQPEEIAERANINCDILLDWLHENYYDFIDEHDPLEQAIDSLETMSLCDSSFRNFDCKDYLEDIRISYLIRGQMFSLNRDASSYCKKRCDQSVETKSKHTFRSLRGPNGRTLAQQSCDNLSKLVAIRGSAFSQSAFAESDKNLVLDIVPCLSSIGVLFEQLQTKNLINYVHELSRISLHHNSDYNWNINLTSDQQTLANIKQGSRQCLKASMFIHRGYTDRSSIPADIDLDSFDIEDDSD